MQTDGAQLNWYIALTRPSQDKCAAAALSSKGIDNYIAIRKVERKWSDRKKVIDLPVLPRVVFVHCTENERLLTLETVPYITRYMSTGHGPFSPAIVPDAQIEAFRMMVDRSNGIVSLRQEPLKAGDKVRVIAGPLKGLETELTSINGKDYVFVRLSMLGAATAEIDKHYIELI